MTDRPMAVIAIEDRDGVTGWGEIWCNFPPGGAEHRVGLALAVLAPLLADRTWQGPADAFAALTRRSHILTLQTGEAGPIAQAIAGIDQALWDIAAQRADLPLWRALGATSKAPPAVPAYASGIHPDEAEERAAEGLARGFEAFKLKLGFGRERDLAALADMRTILPPGTHLAADANQAWDLKEAAHMAVACDDFALDWLEEPMAADASADEWRRLAYAAPMLLAAGENLRGAEFEAALAAHWLGIVQPDLGKWGGHSGCRRVARAALAVGVTYCPHWLGGPIGLAHSAHLLAAIGGGGRLEVDVNPNPAHSAVTIAPPLVAGAYQLTRTPGLGTPLDLDVLKPFEVLRRELRLG
jgi:L-alanine-DL-glutamate epimerase-like enolase superfamily enzyme